MMKSEASPSVHIAFLVSSALFLLLLSTSTSPLYLVNAVNTDPGAYEFIGMSWLHGALPYRDLFDHKGPLIYAINAFGFWLTGNRYGILAVQLPCLYLSLVGCHRLLRQEFGPRMSLLLVFATFTSYALDSYYDGGNMVCDYLLPFLFAAYYHAYSWLKALDATPRAPLPLRVPLLFGLVLGVSLTTRATNALGSCIAVAAVIALLVYQGRFRTLALSGLCYLAGAAIVVVPFLVYFHHYGALADMWHAVIDYNLGYLHVDMPNGVHPLKYVLSFSPSWLLAATAFLALLRTPRYRLLSAVLLLVGQGCGVFFLAGRGYPHYAIVAVPFLPLCFCLFHLTFGTYKRGLRRLGRCTAGVVTVLSLAIVTYKGGGTLLADSTLFHSPKEILARDTTFKGYLDLLALVPEKEYPQLMFVNISRTCVFQVTRVRPPYRYFFLQDFQSLCSKPLLRAKRKAFRHGRAKWIVYNDCYAIQDPYLIAILRHRYRRVAHNSCLSLLRLRE